MDIGWGEARCILCLGTPRAEASDSVMTRAHVIQQSVGGKLFATNECKQCNQRLGHGPEAALVGDPAVRSAAETLAGQIPDLIQRMRRRKVFVACGATGLLVRAVPDADGQDFTIIQTKPETPATHEVARRRGRRPP